MPPLLQIQHIGVELQHTSVLQGISFACQPGEVIGILGPNGAGKTTLLSAIAGELPYQGHCLFAGKSLALNTVGQNATLLALLPQQLPPPESFTVRQFVALGRLPHTPWYQHHDDYGREIEQALMQFELQALASRPCQALSGGEWQRCQLARLAAQQAQLWLLDEPANHLDVRHQHQLLQLLRQQQVAVLASLHDVNLAATYCDKVLLLANGRQVAFGPPAVVFTKQQLETVYQCPVEVRQHEMSGSVQVYFYPPQVSG